VRKRVGGKTAASPLPRRSHRVPAAVPSPRAVPLFQRQYFHDVGRRIATVLFADLPPVRLREVVSTIAHYIAGVLDREHSVALVEGLCESASLKSGDRVKTLRGSGHGVIKRVLEDGRVVWQADGSRTELTALPETLMKEDKP
jgi:hypothetical protein